MSLLLLSGSGASQEGGPLSPVAESWRGELRTIDLHVHIGGSAAHIDRAVSIMDAVGLGVAVNLSGGTVTRGGEAPSALERNVAFFEERAPGRFVQYMSLDYAGWDEDGFGERAAAQIDEGVRLGAAGLKEYKRLGLYLRDGAGKLIAVDDPELDPVWRRCGELGMPVSIHVSDPKAFWEPFEPSNERWEELKDHESWWFGDPEKYPSREALLEARNRVIERHPQTTFLCVHFGNNPEDVAQVGRWLDRYPNMIVDLAARVPELGRHDPELLRALFTRHQDRILFGTDFMVYDQLILGSGGSGPPPTDEDAVDFYRKTWRWMETDDRDFEHMTPIQGDWTIDAIGLPDAILRKVYFDNARRLLARSLPAPVAGAYRIDEDFDLRLDHPAWERARPTWIESEAAGGAVRLELSTEVRLLWSEDHLYLRYECPFTELTVFDTAPPPDERAGLWDRDVVEAFIGAWPDEPGRYVELEVAPTGEQLDLLIDLPDKDLAWSSRFTNRTEVDEEAGRWTTALRIPLRAFDAPAPGVGTRWRMNLYRCDRANRAFLCWRPVLGGSFHAPERFGVLEFRGRR